MTVKETLETTMHDAMRNKDDLTRDTIRVVMAAIKLAEVDAGKPFDDNAVYSIIQKEVKIRRETINELENTDRLDLIHKAEAEMRILEKFLPAQLSDDEIGKHAREVIGQLDAKNMSDMGKVMGILVPKLAGKAPADRISQVVRKQLSQS